MIQVKSGDAGLYRLCRVLLGHNDMYGAYRYSSYGKLRSAVLM